ncbi:MAG: hypothetical protein EB127_00180 [Alphaproteobacteria bacterium]|nr:hypothetical protein [Alphaproteobacteria bacterium]
MARRISEIKDQIFNGVLRREEANYFGPGSILDGLAGDVSSLVFEAELNIENMLGAVHIDSANDIQVDRFAKDFNLYRRPAERASSYDSDKNVVLSTTTGESISSVLTANNIILPGLRITDPTGRKVYVVENTGSNLNNSSCYLTVRAVYPGAEYNVNKNELRRLEKNYNKLKVTNNYSITNGRNPEQTAELRDRIFAKIEANTRNSNALTNLLTQLSNYGKHTVFSNYDGPNSLLVCVQPASGLAYQASTIRDIESKISMFMGTGTKLRVANFTPVVFNFKTKIVCETNAIPMQVASAVKESIVNFFNTLTGGDPVSLSELTNFVMTSVPGLKMLSRVNNTFEEVSYTILEGSSSLTYVATKNETIQSQPTEIATIGSIIINVES